MDTQSTQFTRANVVAQESKIRLVDSDEETGLDLFCYNRCSNEEDDFIKQSRGLVFHGETLVMKAFSYTDEYSHTDVDTLINLMTPFDQWSFYSAYEGALLRLFYFSGRWFLSTHRKLNAFRSKWASRESFGTLFKRALEHEAEVNQDFANRLANSTGENVLDKFQSTLNKNMQYMFLLRNNAENRIVCSPPETKDDPLVLHVGTFIDGQVSMTENVGLCYPYRHSFQTLSELLNHIETDVDPKVVQGVVCFGPNNRQLKILHSEYLEMFRVRGNEPSVKFRYLQVRMDKKMTDMLYKLYPELAPVFDHYEKILYEIACGIHKAYVRRYINKTYVNVPHLEYQVMNECHTWYLSDRKTNRVNLDRVIRILNKQTPTHLNHMIHNFKIEQANKESTVPRTVRSRDNSATNSPAIVGSVAPEPTVLRRLPPVKLT